MFVSQSICLSISLSGCKKRIVKEEILLFLTYCIDLNCFFTDRYVKLFLKNQQKVMEMITRDSDRL